MDDLAHTYVSAKTLREKSGKVKKWRQQGQLLALIFALIRVFEEDLRISYKVSYGHTYVLHLHV